MRNTTKYVALLLVPLFALAISACKGPEGPAGPQGPAGPAGGVVGIDGWATGIESKCGKCHNADQDTVFFVAGRVYQWELSKHAYGGDYDRSTSSCAACHTTEGFVAAVKGKTVASYVNPSPPGCFSCHSPHGTADFSLRTTAPVTLTSGITGENDFTFDYGTGNLCAACHKPRTVSPKAPNPASPGDSLVISTSRWYPHYGVQSQMLAGVGGYKFPSYTYRGNTVHTSLTAIKSEGCVICHMADRTAGSAIAGGHSMNLRYESHGTPGSLTNGCNTSGCHTNLTNINYNNVQTDIEAYMDTLHTLLVAKGYIDDNPASSNYGLVKLTGGKLVVKPAANAGALYNYYFIEHDRSEGGHNAKFAIDLLRSSIAQLRSN